VLYPQFNTSQTIWTKKFKKVWRYVPTSWAEGVKLTTGKGWWWSRQTREQTWYTSPAEGQNHWNQLAGRDHPIQTQQAAEHRARPHRRKGSSELGWTRPTLNKAVATCALVCPSVDGGVLFPKKVQRPDSCRGAVVPGSRGTAAWACLEFDVCSVLAWHRIVRKAWTEVLHWMRSIGLSSAAAAVCSNIFGPSFATGPR
jgi:hypothetical protein